MVGDRGGAEGVRLGGGGGAPTDCGGCGEQKWLGITGEWMGKWEALEGEGLTTCEKAIFREDCDCVDEEDGDCEDWSDGWDGFGIGKG